MNKVFLLILLFDRVTATRDIASRRRRFADEKQGDENAVEKGNVEVVEVKTLN